MTAAYTPRDELFLWWLADPAQPRWVGRLRLVRRTAGHPGGVSLEYADDWLADGLALSEDLPLRPGEFLPVENDAAAGAVDDARPDRWGERVIRHLYKPPRLSTLEYLYFAGDERFGALGVSTSAQRYEPQPHAVLPTVGDVPALLLRRRGDPDRIAANGAQVFRRMVFNILIDNTDDHEKNHALLVDGRRYALAPAYDVLPSGQALGYQQFRVGAQGLDASMANALSEPTAFGLRRPEAEALAREVARVAEGWQAHFAACGVSAGDLARLAEQIDRPYLRGERQSLL